MCLIRFNSYYQLTFEVTRYLLESCAGRVNSHRLRVPVFAGRDEKSFVGVTECWAKAHELNQLKIRKTHGYTEVVCQHCA